MRRHPPSSTLTYTLVPYATLFRSRYVGDILAERQRAVHGKIGERLILVELIGERRPRFIELLEVRLGPPVAQRAGRIERRAVVVETVADLVADHRPDRAVNIGGEIGRAHV